MPVHALHVVKVDSDGEFLTIAPVSHLAYKRVWNILKPDVSFATFGRDGRVYLQPSHLTETDELIGSVGIYAHNNKALAFDFLNALLIELFPFSESSGHGATVNKK